MLARLQSLARDFGLGAGDIARLKNSAEAAQRLELTWDAKAEGALRSVEEQVLKSLLERGHLPALDLRPLFVEHFFDVMRGAYVSVMNGDELARRQAHPKAQQLAAPPKTRIPNTLRELMLWYDRWRKGQQPPPRRAAVLGDAVARKYLKKVQEVWSQHSEPFRSGDAFSQNEAKEAIVREIRNATRNAMARTQTIIRTETTHHYNAARRTYYDASPDVTHYLFLAIRDGATSNWCTPQTREGKRGRHGLVYTKGSALLARETPACHWNCRSEILPLTPANPSHLALIQNLSLRRENVTCWPLPPNWSGRAA